MKHTMITNPLRGLALLAAVALVGTAASAATVTVTNNNNSVAPLAALPPVPHR